MNKKSALLPLMALMLGACAADPVVSDSSTVPNTPETSSTPTVEIASESSSSVIEDIVSESEISAETPSSEQNPSSETLVDGLPSPIDIEMKDIVFSSLDGNALYRTTGILEALDHSDEDGIAAIVDPSSGIYMNLNRTTGSLSPFSYDGETLSFDRDMPGASAVDTLKDVDNGDRATLIFQWNSYFSNAYGVVESHEECTDQYSVVLPESVAHGSVSADVTSGVHGTEVTLTVTPDEGYAVARVAIDRAYAEEAIPNAPYTFKISSYNHVVVEFEDASSTSAVITNASLNDFAASYGNYDGQTTVLGQQIAIHGKLVYRGSNSINVRYNSDDAHPGYIHNSTALPRPIASIEFVLGAYSSSSTNSLSATNAKKLGISVGTSVLDQAPESAGYGEALVKGEAYEWTPTVTDATYFTIGHTTTKETTIYFESITINLVAEAA